MKKRLEKYNHLRDIREDHDLTQIQLANYLNCSQSTYANYELGARHMPTNILNKLADYYHCSVDYLLNRTELREPYPS